MFHLLAPTFKPAPVPNNHSPTVTPQQSHPNPDPCSYFCHTWRQQSANGFIPHLPDYTPPYKSLGKVFVVRKETPHVSNSLYLRVVWIWWSLWTLDMAAAKDSRAKIWNKSFLQCVWSLCQGLCTILFCLFEGMLCWNERPLRLGQRKKETDSFLISMSGMKQDGEPTLNLLKLFWGPSALC